MIHILARAGLMKVESLAQGYLAFNPDLFDRLNER
jgi:hypothetical protein